MRIALVTETFYPAIDATTTTLKALADRLVDLGHQVRIVAPGPGHPCYRTCHVARIQPLEPVGPQVRSAIDRFGADLVIACSSRTLGRKALKHGFATGIPTVVIEQSAVLDETGSYWRSRVAAHADRVVVTSTWMLDRVAEFGVDPWLWTPGVDAAAFTPVLRDQWLHESWSKARTSEGPKVLVGYVGSLERSNQVRRLAELADVPGVRVIVIGGGSQRTWLERRLPKAKFTGPLTTSELTIALPSLDVLVHPGEHQTCAHTLREGAAAGVPLAAPRSGGARDVIRHQDNGLLYDTSDRRQFAEAVTSLVLDRRRALLGERGRELAQERSWVDAVDELEREVLLPLASSRTAIDHPRPRVRLA